MSKHLVTSKGEFVNGYQLFSCNEYFICPELVENIQKLMKSENTQMPFDQFFHLYSSKACSRWGERDFLGNDVLDSSQDPIASCELFKQNARKLYDLPYPKQVMIALIPVCCKVGAEYVRYCNNMCVWTERRLHSE